MYERFTDRARKVMQLANQEAHRFNHEYIGTEHILLGLVKEGAGVGAEVLATLNVDLQKVRREVSKIILSGPKPLTAGKLPETPRAMRVLQFAIEEGEKLRHGHVGTQQLLLGLLREEEGVAAQVLMNLGLKLDNVQKEVANLGDRFDPPGFSQKGRFPPRWSMPPTREYEFHIPLLRSDGSTIHAGEIQDVKGKLNEHFGHVYPSLQQVLGTVNYGDVKIAGEVVVLRIISDDPKQARKFLPGFREEMTKILRQENLLIIERKARLL